MVKLGAPWYSFCTTSVLSLFLTTYTKAVTEGTVSLEPGLRASFSKFMVTMTVIITTFYRSAVSPDCSASPPPQGQLGENCGGLTVYRLYTQKFTCSSNCP